MSPNCWGTSFGGPVSGRTMALFLGPGLGRIRSRACVMVPPTLDPHRLPLLRKEAPVRSHLLAMPWGGGGGDWWWWWRQVLSGSAPRGRVSVVHVARMEEAPRGLGMMVGCGSGCWRACCQAWIRLMPRQSRIERESGLHGNRADTGWDPPFCFTTVAGMGALQEVDGRLIEPELWQSFKA